MPELKEGDPAPDFTLPDAEGKTVSLKDFRGKKAVLFFFPKADTPGWTVEACAFRDRYDAVLKKGAAVLGLSADPVKKQKKFVDKFDLPFPMLCDEGKKALEAYGVWKEKKFMGRKYMGIERTTVIVDEKGKIAKIFPKVQVNGHADEVLKAL